MLKLKYLNKKYFFNKNGPIDEENQNIVIKILKTSVLNLKNFFNLKITYLDSRKNRWLEQSPRREAFKYPD
jgi:hypothetical protein